MYNITAPVFSRLLSGFQLRFKSLKLKAYLQGHCQAKHPDDETLDSFSDNERLKFQKCSGHIKKLIPVTSALRKENLGFIIEFRGQTDVSFLHDKIIFRRFFFV